MCTVCVPGVCRGPKRPLDPSEMELQMTVSHNVSVENKPSPSEERVLLASKLFSSPVLHSLMAITLESCCVDGLLGTWPSLLRGGIWEVK